ncbi:MAG: polyribonucleotide nucleotidyltransferase [Phycisphaerales bacterium]|jgi:polyribonucleotide nucleotidyltransferase|nr:polyribonucleotide nucleotidyltransferase [Phycisphaerales bacterium]
MASKGSVGGAYASKLSRTLVSREIGGRTLTLETGRVAKLANSCVIATYGGTTVMATVVRADPRPGLDFFPMQVDYREKLTAAGKYPGGFRKREGQPSEKEILTMRMIDRPIRPLFPDGFIDEVQIQCWVMSHDGENDSDVLAGTAASAALAISNAPFEGPTATVRVGRIITDDGEKFVINPTVSQMDYSDIDLVLAGHVDGINMIEVGAAEVPEKDVLAAIEFGYGNIKETLALIDELVKKVGQEKVIKNPLVLPPDEIFDKVKKLVEKDLTAARQIPGKAERSARVDEIRKAMIEQHFKIKLDGTPGDADKSQKDQTWAKESFRRLEKKITRRLITESGIRADGRGATQLRPIECEVGVFQRTHGSALFQRGETQSLVSCALGTGKDEQIIDGLLPEYSKKFYLHYNFPPFCVGEAGRIMGPGRREIGHGALAERSLMAIIPNPDDFPYTVRLVSDITESNGSSSMASVCGGCLALMDAGVPILNTCAGISVGRFTNDDESKELFVTDIIGEEDFFGDMDFKVSGTREGITGIQLDLKARGLSVKQIDKIFAQARDGRLEIIDIMERAIPAPREHISVYAPRLVTIQIDPEKIGKLIGPGGKVIRGLQDKYGISIDVSDDGKVVLASPDGSTITEAQAEIEAMCAEIKVGTIFNGKVVSMRDFGAFIELAPGTDGMCHISELADGYVKSVADVVKIGDIVKVKVINIDDQGRIKLSRKAVLKDEQGQQQPEAVAVED